MRKVMVAALAAAQLLSAQPVVAAELAAAEQTSPGAFAGLRVRVPLDGDVRERRARAGLTVAPTMLSRRLDGATRLSFGEGVELGLGGPELLRLTIAGRDVRRLGAAQQGEEDDERRGPSTVAWVAIGVAALVVVTAGVGYLVLEDRIDED